MTRGVAGQSPANIQKYLANISYPASKKDLLETAKANNAPGEVIKEIGALPGDSYAGPQEVMKAYGELH